MLLRCQQGHKQDVGPFAKQMCQGTFFFILLQVQKSIKGSISVCKN